jgi:tetratricopeptide (TPR) repeat protein
MTDTTSGNRDEHGNPADGETAFNDGNYYMGLGSYQQAVDSFRTAFEHGAKGSVGWNLAYSYSCLGDLQQAQEWLNWVLSTYGSSISDARKRAALEGYWMLGNGQQWVADNAAGLDDI